MVTALCGDCMYLRRYGNSPSRQTAIAGAEEDALPPIV